MRLCEKRFRAVVVIGVVMLAAFLVTPVKADEGGEGEAPARVLGACCVELGVCETLPELKCQEMSAESSWWSEVRCVDVVCGACADGGSKTCVYSTDDMCTGAKELFCPKKDCAACLEEAEGGNGGESDSDCMMHRLFSKDAAILAHMVTFHDFQNRIAVESEKGREMKALFHEHMLELGLILFRNPDLKQRGMDLLEVAAPGFRDLLGEEDGVVLVLTPSLVQTIDEFLSDVAGHAGPEACAALDRVKSEFQAVKGMSLRQIRAQVNGELVQSQ